MSACPLCGAVRSRKPLSPKRARVLRFISDFTEANGYPPSFKEIATALHLRSLATVHEHVEQLRRDGYIVRHGHNVGRNIEVTPPVQP